MQLDELYGYKNRLMRDLLTSPEIVKLIDETIDPEEAESLVYNRVFPCEYVPDTVQQGMTFVCIDVDVEASINKTFLSPVIYIWVFTHRSNLRLPDGGGVRTDALCHEICKAINGSRTYGLGELTLYSVKRFAPMTDFQGKRLAFRTKDINFTYDPNKYTPANRKDSWVTDEAD